MVQGAQHEASMSCLSYSYCRLTRVYGVLYHAQACIVVPDAFDNQRDDIVHSKCLSTTSLVSAKDSSTSLGLLLLLCDLNNVYWNAIETHALEQVLGVLIDVELATRLRVLSKVQSRNFWDVLILSFTFLFLQLEGDTSDRTSLNSLHQMSSVASDLNENVSKLKW